MVMPKVKIPLIIFLFFLSGTIMSQKEDQRYRPLIDDLVQRAPSTYNDIDLKLRTIRTDTLKMVYLLNQAQKSGYAEGVSYAYNRLGIKSRDISDFNRSIEYHESALDAADRVNNAEFKIWSLNLLGTVYYRNDAIKAVADNYDFVH